MLLTIPYDFFLKFFLKFFFPRLPGLSMDEFFVSLPPVYIHGYLGSLVKIALCQISQRTQKSCYLGQSHFAPSKSTLEVDKNFRFHCVFYGYFMGLHVEKIYFVGSGCVVWRVLSRVRTLCFQDMRVRVRIFVLKMVDFGLEITLLYRWKRDFLDLKWPLEGWKHEQIMIFSYETIRQIIWAKK